MNIINSSYLHYTFQTTLKLEIDLESGKTIKGTFIHATNIIYNWIKKKFPSLKLPTKVCSMQKDYFTQSVDIMYSWENTYFCMRTSHTDRETANRVWITEAELIIIDDDLYLGIKNAYTSTMLKSDEDYKMYAVPIFVRKISNTLSLTDANNKTGNIYTVSNNTDLENLLQLIINKKRKLPVIVISERVSSDLDVSKYFEIDGGYLVDGNRLAEDLSFIAHVFYLPQSFQKIWSTMIGDMWAVFNGAVRTYYPDVNLESTDYYNHPYLVATKIMSMSYSFDDDKEYLGGHAFRHRLTHTIKTNNMYQRINWSQLGYKFFYQANKEEKFAKAQLFQGNGDWCQLLEDDNKELEKQIKELNILFSLQEDEYKQIVEVKNKLGAINLTNQMRIVALEKELIELRNKPNPIEYPSTYEDIPSWVQDNYLGRIELHSRAIKSLKNAEFKDVVLVCKVINLLGTVYYNMRLGLVNKTDYENELNILGVDDLPAISDVSAGEQGDEYFPLYNGRRCKLERHITKGVSRDARECLRVYFFWDYENNQVVIGSLPSHLSIRSSN